jgi:hypothetical protein
MSKPEAGKRHRPSCHRSPTLSQTVRQLQHHFSVAKSVTSTTRQDVSMHRCDWKHKVGKRPAPSRNRSSTLSQTVRGHRHSPSTISRWQNLSRPPPAPRCAHLGVTGNTQGPHPACAVAPSRSPTLSQTARGHQHSPNTVSRCREICGAHHPRQDVCNRRCNRKLKVTKLPETSHRRSATLFADFALPRARHHRFSML